MNQIELEQEIQRFAGEFISRVSSAGEVLTQEEDDAELSQAALRRVLAYTSSALDIAAGPTPEINLLDMTVFVTLSRRAFETHFVPHVFGDAARPLLEALAVSEREVWAIASRALEQPEVRQLAAATDKWAQENPDNVNVEMVRFREFAARAGELREGSDREGGLIRRVKATVQAADHAMMLGERAMFLVQRMPFVLRLHARVAAQDLVLDSAVSLKASRLGWRLVGYLAAVGGAWAVSFWGGYHLTRRLIGGRRSKILAF